MSLASMTGFARVDGVADGARYVWEVRSVNAKGLDIRLRLPNGFDGLEGQLRAAVAAKFTRGSVSATLTVQRPEPPLQIRINEAALEEITKLSRAVGERLRLAPPHLDSLLGLPGIVSVQPVSVETEFAGLAAAVAAAFETALGALASSRLTEGQSLERILGERLATILGLTNRADALPARQADAIRARLQQQVDALLGEGRALDPDRLHQEAMLLAIKADVREELDRLKAHVTQARDLLAGGGAVGRRLDFLSQEFGREANTLCAKSNDLALTAIGLDLKAVVEQFREQVQNLE